MGLCTTLIQGLLLEIHNTKNFLIPLQHCHAHVKCLVNRCLARGNVVAMVAFFVLKTYILLEKRRFGALEMAFQHP